MSELGFKTAFKYPFNRAKGMWNILWLLVPIIGWFALIGYSIRIVQEFCKGQFKKLPIFKFSKDLEFGFFMFLKSLPFVLAYLLIVTILEVISPWFAVIRIFFEIFMMPVLAVNSGSGY